MFPKLPALNGKKCFKFNEDFVKNLEVDAEYPKNLNNLHFDLPFLPERINKCNKLACNLYN